MGVLLTLAIFTVLVMLVESTRPPWAAAELVRLLNATKAERVRAFSVPPAVQTWPPSTGSIDHLVNQAELFISLGTGPWRLVKWGPKGAFPQEFVVEDADGLRAFVEVLVPEGEERIIAVDYWRYVEGDTLPTIADSAVEIVRPKGMVVGCWINGKTQVESRGIQSGASEVPLTDDSRWPLILNLSLLHLAIARAFEAGDLSWDDRLRDRLPKYQLPLWAESVTVGDLIRGRAPQGFPFAVLPDRFSTTGFAHYLQQVFASDENHWLYPSHNNAPENLILMAVLESATKLSAEAAIQRHVLDPLLIESGRFAKLPEGAFPDFRRPQQALDAPFLAEGKPFTASMGDLLKLGRAKLDEERGESGFLQPGSLAVLAEFGVREPWGPSKMKSPEGKDTWGWSKRKTPKGEYWSIYLGGWGIMGVFPKLNAVVAVIVSDPQDTFGPQRPIFWRIAEQVCGWPQ